MRRFRLVTGALAVLAASAVLVLGRWAGTALVVSQPLSEPDVIVSLASHEWERLSETARQAVLFPKALVLLTLPPSVNKYNCHDCANRVPRLARAGLSPHRIRVLPVVEPGTYGEALATKRFAEFHKVVRVLVVTSPYHTRRSLATFRGVMQPVAAVVGVVPASATSPARPETWWASPYDRAYVAYEWAGLFYYQAYHRLPMFTLFGARAR